MKKPRRCLLFVPGSRPERFDKALATGADMVCIDLEDAVLPDAKDAARRATLDYVGTYAEQKTELAVRINALDSDAGQADLSAIAAMQKPPALIMLPKTSSASQLKSLENRLAAKAVEFIALIETAEGLHNANTIALSSPRLVALMLGGADLSAELRAEMSWDALLYARGKLAAAAALTQLDLIDVPFLDVKNDAGLRAECQRVKAMGFSNKAAIHPAQVDIIQEVYTPTEAQIAQAKKVVDAHQHAGGGAFLVDGKMVDRPVLLSMQRILAIAESV